MRDQWEQTSALSNILVTWQVGFSGIRVGEASHPGPLANELDEAAWPLDIEDEEDFQPRPEWRSFPPHQKLVIWRGKQYNIKTMDKTMGSITISFSTSAYEKAVLSKQRTNCKKETPYEVLRNLGPGRRNYVKQCFIQHALEKAFKTCFMTHVV